MRSLFSRLCAVLTALAVLAVVAGPVAAQGDDAGEPAPAPESPAEPIPEPQVPVETITGVDGSGPLHTGVDRRVTVDGSGLTRVAFSPDGPNLACYLMNTTERHADFVNNQRFDNLITGRAYWRLCFDSAGNIADDRVLIWGPGWLEGTPGFLLLEQARDNVDFPEIVLELSPSAVQLTGLETWFTTTSPLVTDVSSVSLGGETVSAWGEFALITIDPGDGSPAFHCTFAPGTTCAHTYLVEPEDGSYDVTAEVTWNITEIPLDGAFQFDTEILPGVPAPVDVRDLEALITR